MKQILFISHDASRTGAPFVLLHFIKWLKSNNPSLAIDVLLLRGGELETDYRECANVFVLSRSEKHSLFRRGVSYVKRKYFRPFRHSYEVVVGNTALTLEYLELFKNRGARTVSWIHELEFVVSQFFSCDRFVELSKSVDCFIAVSKPVAAMLNGFGIKTRVELVYEFAVTSSSTVIDVGPVRKEVGIPTDGFIVGSGGTIDWRKGPDILLHIASRVMKENRNIRFLWIGGRSDKTCDEYRRVQYDLNRMGLGNHVIFTGVTDAPRRFLSAIDVFTLTSREDPFPLICIEAASLGKPVICFEKSGGIPELVQEDAGFVVPYLDVEATARRIIELYHNANLREQMGKAAALRARTQHSISDSAPKILHILEELMAPWPSQSAEARTLNSAAQIEKRALR